MGIPLEAHSLRLPGTHRLFHLDRVNSIRIILLWRPFANSSAVTIKSEEMSEEKILLLKGRIKICSENAVNVRDEIISSV